MRKITKILAVTCALILTLTAFSSYVNNVRAQVTQKEIIVDGNPTDWAGIAPTDPNTGTIDAGEYIWTDAVDDDKGDGDYIYPTDVAYAGDNCADLTEFRVTANMTHLFFLIKLASLPNPWSGPYGFSLPIINIYIDQDPGTGKGYNTTLITTPLDPSGATDADFAREYFAWEYAVVITSWDVYLMDSPTSTKGDIIVAGDPAYNAIEAAVPFTMLGWGERATGQTWRFVVIIGINSFGTFNEVLETAQQWYPGGGLGVIPWGSGRPWKPEDVECDAFDGAFYTSNENQYADWSDYDATTNKITVLGNYPTDTPEGYVDIESGEGKVIPRFPDPVGLRISFFQLGAAKVNEGEKISVHVNVVYDVNNSMCRDANVSGTVKEVPINFISMGNGTYLATIETIGLSDYFASKNYTLFIIAEKKGFSVAASSLSFEVTPSFWSIAPIIILVLAIAIAVTGSMIWTFRKRRKV